MILAYERTLGNEEVEAIFNRSEKEVRINVPVKGDGEFQNILSSKNEIYKSADKMITLSLMPVSGIVLKRK
jgi:hypothetical protein